MTFKLFGAALILSTAFATPVFAQVRLPGDYAFLYPDGDLGIRYGDAMSAQRAQVNVGGLKLATRSHRTHHYSPTSAR